MKIAFLHYHLRRGGVTTVIKQQIDAIKSRSQVMVLTGEDPPNDFPAETATIPNLNYDIFRPKEAAPQETADQIIEAIHHFFRGPCDILHIHNPTLAKNRHMLAILKNLQSRNLRLFMQIHDFAEDGRPQAYLHEEYPQDCHYGVINTRDYQFLRRAGLQPEGLHLVANMVQPLQKAPEGKIAVPFVLYPVRAIRRKNIGEALLLSLFLKPDTRLYITLPPNSPADAASYRYWQVFANEKRLRVFFEAGLKYDFNQLVNSTRFFVTTSINEGFGFSFLEPWTIGKALWGRRLSALCQDFNHNGIDLNHLYDRLLVPIDWIDCQKFKARWVQCVTNCCRQYRIQLPQSSLDDAFQKITQDDVVDLGLLDEVFQSNIIEEMLANPAARRQLVHRNPFLRISEQIISADELIQSNHDAVLYQYGQKAYGQRLLQAYANVMQTDVRHKINKSKLLAQFFNLNDFSLLKWGYPEIGPSMQ